MGARSLDMARGDAGKFLVEMSCALLVMAGREVGGFHEGR